MGGGGGGGWGGGLGMGCRRDEKATAIRGGPTAATPTHPVLTSCCPSVSTLSKTETTKKFSGTRKRAMMVEEYWEGMTSDRRDDILFKGKRGGGGGNVVVGVGGGGRGDRGWRKGI